MANGDLHLLGTFYKAGEKQLVPTNPWRIGSTPGGGNIPSFSTGQSLEIRDTDPDSAYQLRWREVNIGPKKLLIADRNILERVSWDDLNAQNLIFGKNVTIDGQQYKLRVLTGGEENRIGGTGESYEGGKLPNEWDDIIVNEGNYLGLPKPSSTDLDSNLNNTDKNSVHNQFWNWYYMYSWCQEAYKYGGESRVHRGYASARRWNWGDATYRSHSIGWRPVLEVLNSAPTISGSDQNLGELFNKPDPINYTVNDAEGDTLTITERIDGRILRTFSTTSGTTHTLQLSDIEWLKTRLNTAVQMTITVSDPIGSTATRTYTLTRKETAIDFQLKEPFETDVPASRILLTLDGRLPLGIPITIEACNNAFDSQPTWENVTSLALQGLPFPFQNKTKTASKWGVSFRVRIERGTETGEIYLDGIGGAFD